MKTLKVIAYKYMCANCHKVSQIKIGWFPYCKFCDSELHSTMRIDVIKRMMESN